MTENLMKSTVPAPPSAGSRPRNIDGRRLHVITSRFRETSKYLILLEPPAGFEPATC
jgi:hypothetical protein